MHGHGVTSAKLDRAGVTRTRQLVARDDGATAVEYGIMVALIAAVIIVSVIAVGTATQESFQCTADRIDAREEVDCD